MSQMSLSAFANRKPLKDIVKVPARVQSVYSLTQHVNLTTFEKLRTHILLKRSPLVTMLDLGFGILDGATVETAALVARGRRQQDVMEKGGAR